MRISAKVIADSINPAGNRITTFVLVYPRFVHCEILTHRALSRNSASSRAIPISKMIEAVTSDPAEPIHWGKNQRGMQAAEELGEGQRQSARNTWLLAAKVSTRLAQLLSEQGVHKQIANRL